VRAINKWESESGTYPPPTHCPAHIGIIAFLIAALHKFLAAMALKYSYENDALLCEPRKKQRDRDREREGGRKFNDL